MERPSRDKKGGVWAREGGCVLTRPRPPSVMPELAHIVSQSSAKYKVGLDSPLYSGFRLFLSPEQIEETWYISGEGKCQPPVKPVITVTNL